MALPPRACLPPRRASWLWGRWEYGLFWLKTEHLSASVSRLLDRATGKVGQKRRVRSRQAQEMSGENGVLLSQKALRGDEFAVGEHFFERLYDHVVSVPRPAASLPAAARRMPARCVMATSVQACRTGRRLSSSATVRADTVRRRLAARRGRRVRVGACLEECARRAVHGH